MPSAPSIPNAPDPSALPSQLPGGLGDSAKRASDLANQMQGMSCPEFNPGMPGAAKAEELSQHLTTIGDAANKIKNPMADELNQTQDALNKLRNSPTPENMKNYQDKAQALKDKAQQTYGASQDAKQKASDFASNAQPKANPEDGVAQQRAAQKLQESASQYQQAASDKSADMLKNVDSSAIPDYKSNAQQAMYNAAQKQMPDAMQNMSEDQVAQKLSSDTAAQLQQQYSNNQELINKTQEAITNSGAAKDYVNDAQKAQQAQQAAEQMRSQLPPVPSFDPSQLPPNPYANLNNTMQSLTLPNCPQLSGLQNQLSTVQGDVSSMMCYDSMTPAMQKLQDMKGQMSGLSDAARAKAESELAEVEGSLGGGGESENEAPQPGLIVVNGAQGMCPMAMGSPFKIQALPAGSEANSKPMAQPLTALYTCSGNCMSMKNLGTASLTATAMGVLTPGPCLISMPELITWQQTSKGAKTAGPAGEVILNLSIGACQLGGPPLMITDPAQQDAVSKSG